MNLILLVGVGLFLLIVGTLLGRFYTPDRRPLKQAAEEGKAYMRSLVDVLEGNNDVAIKKITNALRQNSKSVEAYFALGTLFRKRGEFERAVRVHQTILARRDIDKQTRLRVRHQLGLDFRAAGFPNRAVKALEWVVTQDKNQLPSLQQLALLYETTGQWERAVLIHRRLGKITGVDTSALQAHMLTELAHQALEQRDLVSARKHLKRAISADSSSVHALHVLALYHQHRQKHGAAAKAWDKALRLKPDLALFFATFLERALFEDNRVEAFERLLQELHETHRDNLHLRLAYARFDAKRNPQRALTELSDILATAPSLLPARREAAKLILDSGDPASIRRALHELLETVARADRGYRCGSCGHAGDQLFWRCPSCGAWDRVRAAWGRREGEGA